MIFRRGATAYEVQVWRVYARYVFLQGGHWRKTRLDFWNRFSIHWDYDEDGRK